LEKLGDTTIDHHGRTIIDCLAISIDYGLSGVGVYMDKRFKRTAQFKEYVRGMLSNKEGMTYANTLALLWDDKD